MLKTDKRLRNGETVILGYVGFNNPDFAEKAMEDKDLTILDKPVKITYARGHRNRSQRYSRTKLHVFGIGNMHESQLVEMLGNCELIWPKDPKNIKRPYVFAQFNNESDKKDAIEKLNGRKIDEENTLKLSPAYSQRFSGRGPVDRRRRYHA